MKKIIFSIMAMLLLSISFMSCKNATSDYSDMDILTVDDISEDWLNGYWSGTEVEKVDGKGLTKMFAKNIEPTEHEITSRKYYVSDIKEFIEKDGEVFSDSSTFETCAYANKERNKMVLEEVMSTKVAFVTVKTITTTTVTKDVEED